MDRNAKYSIVAVAVLLVASAGVVTLFSVEASTNDQSPAQVVSSPNLDRTPLKQGWNTITAKWNFVLKTAEIEKKGTSNIIPVAFDLKIISDKIISASDGRQLGPENEINQGEQIEVYLNQADPNDSPAFIIKR